MAALSRRFEGSWKEVSRLKILSGGRTIKTDGLDVLGEKEKEEGLRAQVSGLGIWLIRWK